MSSKFRATNREISARIPSTATPGDLVVLSIPLKVKEVKLGKEILEPKDGGAYKVSKKKE